MKELKIYPPEGYEIDHNKSDLVKGIVKFKKTISISEYSILVSTIFEGKEFYYIGEDGVISETMYVERGQERSPNISLSFEQLEAVLAINILANIARALNGSWPNFHVNSKWVIFISGWGKENTFMVNKHSTVTHSGVVYFKSRELALKAIEIIDEKTLLQTFNLSQ